ncbi:sepiapterin reductase-like [Macrobrachium nipponense]|uniref:sepiapterin reductase-like n=1 Tax=Macrobrachium nipponense TaxID=159736 RepID=UPI0030C8D164
MDNQQRNIWVLVTGASRGLGQALCVGLAEKFGGDLMLVGMARSEDGLKKTAAMVDGANNKTKFIPIVMDLGTADAEGLSSAMEVSFKAEGRSGSPKRALIIHNAGTLGHLKYLRDQQDLAHATEYFRLNVSSVISLNAIFLDYMRTHHPKTSLEVVNISSLCALQPFKSWGLYCSGKAARDMLFRVLAAEEPDVTVLSYAPGPLDNDMQATARSATADQELRSAFASMKDEGKLLSCEESVRKFLRILDAKKFKSGDHVDYYDEL